MVLLRIGRWGDIEFTETKIIERKDRKTDMQMAGYNKLGPKAVGHKLEDADDTDKDADQWSSLGARKMATDQDQE